jgi:hypothetical protein
MCADEMVCLSQNCALPILQTDTPGKGLGKTVEVLGLILLR